MENIDIIREVREKIKKNPKYMFPVNKEFQEDIKKYEFNSGFEYISWMRINGILKKVKDYPEKFSSRNEYEDFFAKRLGYIDRKEYNREKVNTWNHKSGKCTDSKDNWVCSHYLGIHIAQKKLAKIILPIVLGNIKQEMGTNNIGFDFLIEGDIKVDVKSRVLSYREKRKYWEFPIEHNKVADYFMLMCLDNMDDLNIVYVLLFKKDDLVRGREFWNREEFTITNEKKYLIKLNAFNVTKELESLKDLITYEI